MTVALIAPAFSPAIGGMIIDSFSWRWVFFANLPFALLASILAWVWVKDGEKQLREKPDIIGLLLVSLSLLGLLLSFTLYNDEQSWVLALLSFGVSAVLLRIYLKYAQNAEHLF